MYFSKETLIKLNQQGFIPGPDETEDAFLQRVDYCLHLKKNLNREWKVLEKAAVVPQKREEECLQAGIEEVRPLFDFAPTWVPLFFSNEKLSPWHGGCAWIFQKDEKTPPGALLQLRKSWAFKERLYGMYTRKELIGHEMVHIGRMAFHEPMFEEFFAYQTSPYWLRKFFGPFFESSREVLLFLLCLLIPLLADGAVLVSGFWELYHSLFWLKILPFLFISWGLGRLLFRWRMLKKAKQALGPLLRIKEEGEAVLFRLTDSEVCAFSKMKTTKIREYMGNVDSLRWRLLKGRYFEMNSSGTEKGSDDPEEANRKPSSHWNGNKP